MSKARFAALVAAAAVMGVALGLACATTDVGCAECDRASCCDEHCANLDADPNNCGSCGNVCGQGRCELGLCLCGTATCRPGEETCCEDECVVLSRDPDHCGSCAKVCDADVGCSGGVCTGAACPGGCAAGTECCGGRCVNVSADSSNCGRCGNACGAGRTCEDGTCITYACSPTCSGAAPDCCGNTCTSTSSDSQNCGFCGNQCLPPLADRCVAGPSGGRCGCGSTLACRAGQLCCGDGGCRDVATDEGNCGECGRRCDAGQTCIGGVCSCGSSGGPCAAGETCCGGACIDTSSDPRNCGSCGATCSGTSDNCAGGACRCGSSPACRAGFLYCMDPFAGQRCCDGECVDVGPTMGCSACGAVCAEGQQCFGLLPVCSCLG